MTIHVWLIPYRTCDEHQWRIHLSEAEQQQAAAFARPHLAQRYRVVHGVLRHLLAPFCDSAPASLRFTANDYGKPSLPGSDVYFNLSYTKHYALIAISTGRTIGVDIEAHRAVRDMNGVMGLSFSIEEQQAIHALPQAQQRRAFFAVWARKEAIIKAMGLGLAFPVTALTVSTGEPVEVLSIHGDPAPEWKLHALTVPDGYSAAVAYQGQHVDVQFSEFDGC